MKLKAIRGHFVGGKQIAVGKVYEAPDPLARELIATGKAEPAAEVTRTKGAMTTETTTALVQGKGDHHAR